MEGKRFGFGLAAGVLLALAVVAVSGGLGSSLSGTFAPAGAAVSAPTTTVASATVTMSTTTIPPTTTFSVTSTVSIATTTNGGSESSLNSNGTYPYGSITTSSTTVTITASSAPSTTSSSSPGSQSTGTSATSGTPYNFYMPSETNRPTQLANIAQQPITSKAEILAPILIAFLLGAFIYRVATQERERSSETNPESV